METRTSRNPFKKLVSLVLVMTMVMAMGITSFAATSDPNMTSSEWTVYVAPGKTTTLHVLPANSSYSGTGFSSTADAEAVKWSTTNENIATIQSTSSETSDAGLIYATAAVKVPETAAVGSCSVKAVNPATGAYINITVIVKSDATQNASDVNVYVPDLSGDYSVASVSYSTEKFATPMDALKALKADTSNDFSYEGTDTYVSKISANGAELEEYTDYDATTGTYAYYGWNYRVYRLNATGTDSDLVDDSAVIGAGAFTLQDKDTVVWLWGTEEMANAFFADTLSGIMQ